MIEVGEEWTAHDFGKEQTVYKRAILQTERNRGGLIVRPGRLANCAKPKVTRSLGTFRERRALLFVVERDSRREETAKYHAKSADADTLHSI